MTQSGNLPDLIKHTDKVENKHEVQHEKVKGLTLNYKALLRHML